MLIISGGNLPVYAFWSSISGVLQSRSLVAKPY